MYGAPTFHRTNTPYSTNVIEYNHTCTVQLALQIEMTDEMLCCFCPFVAAPDRLYEVKVWAFNKQTEGYPAVWKGKTEKFTERGAGTGEDTRKK